MMETLIYLDSNIYIDYFDNRTDYLRPLGAFAFELLRRMFGCEFKIAISAVVAEELIRNNRAEQLKNLAMRLREREKLVEVEILPEDFQKAKALSQKRNSSFNDALHAVVASKAKAEYLVTRNIEHLEKFGDMIKVVYPENI